MLRSSPVDVHELVVYNVYLRLRKENRSEL